MTQYTEKVQEALRRQAVEKWSKKALYITAQHGYVETALNDGSVRREYHRDYGTHKAGDVVMICEKKSLDKLMWQAPTDLSV